MTVDTQGPPERATPSRILVVDDDLLILETIVLTLRGQGWVVESVPDGLSAIGVLVRGATDLVVTDLDLPILGGAELIATIDRRWPDLPVIVISGGPCDLDMDAAGGRWNLPKPFAPRHLADLVRYVLARTAPPASDVDDAA